jgi:FemAB-related protein (PEP-CTERM system-associated)
MTDPIQYQLLPESEAAEWDDYVLSHQASVYHLHQWKPLIESVFGHKSYYCVAKHHNKIVGIMPLINLRSVMFGNYLVSMPYFNYGGIIANSASITEGLLNFSENLRNELDCQHCEIRMDQPLENEFLEVVKNCRTDKVTMLLELPEDPDALWSSIGAKRRAQVKRPIREGASFKMGGIELLNDFYQVFSLNMRDLGTPVYSQQFFEGIIKNFPSKSQIAIVYLNNMPVGAGFLISHNGTMEIPWASTNRKFNRFGINMYLYWNILKTAIQQGAHQFDFGRSSKDAGTLKFKKQWGAQPKQLYWYYQLKKGHAIPQLNHNNKKLKLLIEIWKKLPLSFTNRIGPLIVKNLP